MGNFCIYIPNAPNTNKPSKLFTRLQQEFGRQNAIAIWSKLSTEEFYIKYAKQNPLTLYDENGEILFESALEYINLDAVLDIPTKIAQHEEELNSNPPTTNIDYVQRAVSFNKRGLPFVAVVEDIPVQGSTSKDKMYIKVYQRDDSIADKISAQEKALNTYNAVDRFLNTLGIDIRILDSNRFHGEDGILLPEKLYDDTDSIFGVINIANNMKGLRALPEEFGHFLIECVKDNPVVKRAINYLDKTPGLIEEILGSEYADVVTYYESKGRADLVAKEALGRLLINDINNDKLTDVNPLSESWLKSKLKNLSSNVKSIFRLRTIDQANALQEIRDAVMPIVRSINDRNRKINSILTRFKNYGDSLAHTHSKLKNAQEVLRNNDSLLNKTRKTIAENIQKYKSIYKHIKVLEGTLANLDESLEKLVTDVPKSLDTRVKGLKPISNDLEAEGIAQIGEFMVKMNNLSKQCFDSMSKIEESAVDSDYNVILKNAQELRRVQNFIFLGQNCYPEIYNLLRSLISLEGEENAPYVEYGKTLMTLLDEMDVNCNKLHTEFLNLSDDVMHTLFLPMFSQDNQETIEREGFYRGSNTSTLALGDIMEYSLGDIAWISRLVNAYYDMGDPYLNLVHFMIRRKQEQTRREVQAARKEWEELLNEYERENGNKDLSWMHEYDDAGNPTGYYRNKYGIDFKKFYDYQKAKNKELNEKFGFNTKEKRAEMSDWILKNTRDVKITTYYRNANDGSMTEETDDEKKIIIQIPVKNDLWKSNQPPLTANQEKWLNRVLEYKNKCDQLLPIHIVTRAGAQYYKCPQRVAGSVAEAVCNGKDGFVKELGNVLEDKILQNPNEIDDDDYDYGVSESEQEENSEDKMTESIFNRVKMVQKLRKLVGKIRSRYSSLSYDPTIQQMKLDANLSRDEIIDRLNNDQQYIHKDMTDDTYYYITEEDGQIHKYSRVHAAIGPQYKSNGIADSNTESLDAGNAYDKIYREFFNGVSLNQISKPSNMSKAAFDTLLKRLNSIKQRMEFNGEKFLANNIVLFHKFADGKRVAGEVDILAIDKDGNISIYDVKTTRGKMINWSRKKANQYRSTKDQYSLQLSAYKDLFECSYGVPVKRLALIGNEITIIDGIVTSHNDEKIREVSYNPKVSVKLSQANPAIRGKIAIEDDTVVNVQTTMNNQHYKRIPMYFVKKLSDLSRLSTDVPTSIFEYAEMAYTFNGRHEIADIVELATTIAENRKIREMSDDRTLMESIKTRLGDGASNEFVRVAERSAQNSNIVEAIKTLRDKHIYGEYRVDQSTLSEGQLSINKLTDMMLRYTAFSMLAYNAFTGINNLVVGKYQTMIEAAGGEYFNLKDWGEAELTVNSQLLMFVKDYLSPIKSNKLYLVNELFNIDQNWKKVLEGQAFYKSGLVKLGDILNPSFMMEAGEKNLKLITGVAFLKAYKLKRIDKSTNKTDEISLYDALTVEQDSIDRNARLVLAGGDKYIYLKPNGDDFTLSNGSIVSANDVRDISLRIGVVNHRMHGIYNSEDVMAAKRMSLGKVFTMYRNFIPATAAKRLKKSQYNFILGQFEEGFMRTFGRCVLGAVFRPNIDGKKMDLSQYIEVVGQQMTNHQKANFRRACTELVSIIGTFCLLNFGLGGWKDHRGEWGNRALYFFMHRLLTEQMFYYNPLSAWEILQSPTPAMSPMQKWMKLFESLLNPRVLESGPYKGRSNVYAAFMRALPVWWGIADFANLADDDKRFQYMNN